MAKANAAPATNEKQTADAVLQLLLPDGAAGEEPGASEMRSSGSRPDECNGGNTDASAL